MIEITIPWYVLPELSEWENRLNICTEMGIWLEERIPGEYEWVATPDHRFTVLLPSEEVVIMFKLAFAYIWTHHNDNLPVAQ